MPDLRTYVHGNWNNISVTQSPAPGTPLVPAYHAVNNPRWPSAALPAAPHGGSYDIVFNITENRANAGPVGSCSFKINVVREPCPPTTRLEK
eukprot:tig00021468_g21638.t1